MQLPESVATSLNHRDDEPTVTIEMGGANLVIRASAHFDHASTISLVSAVNAAADADVAVVIDPSSVRCDDEFARYGYERTAECRDHDSCRPDAVQVVGSGIIRITAERTVWTIDVAHGRLCRTDGPLEVRFLGPEAWTPVVAVCVTPSRLVALLHDDAHVSERRAHGSVVDDRVSEPAGV
jgi:hypothetical protein